jgi:hypothetical protein
MAPRPQGQELPEQELNLETSPATRKPSYYAKDAIKGRQRIGDLERWARVSLGRPPQPRTVETRRFHVIALHHLAHYAEGPVLAENFLSTWTDLSAAERAAMVRTEFRSKRFYEAEELAELIGLTMPTRYALGITTIGAIDFPRAARQRFQELKGNAIKRRGRRASPSVPKPRRKANRRLAAMLAVLPQDGTMLSVKEAGARLSTAGEFARVAAASLPRVLRRLIDIDAGERLVAKVDDAAFAGMLVGRRLDHQASSPKKELRPPPPRPQERLSEPTDAIEFERWFFSELGRFTAETAVEMARWFYDERGRAIREECQVAELENDLAKIAKHRRDELVGTNGQKGRRRVG